jgi:hypothetical protein
MLLSLPARFLACDFLVLVMFFQKLVMKVHSHDRKLQDHCVLIL